MKMLVLETTAPFQGLPELGLASFDHVAREESFQHVERDVMRRV